MIISVSVVVPPNVKFPVYPSVLSMMPRADLSKFITVKVNEKEFKIYDFIIDAVDAKYFKSMMNFKEGETRVINLDDFETFEAFYDFCYSDYDEWIKKYSHSEDLEEMLTLADYISCERFFNTVLSLIAKESMNLRRIIEPFIDSNKDNKYYQKILKRSPYDEKEYEDMDIFHFKQTMRNRNMKFEAFKLKKNLEDISFDHEPPLEDYSCRYVFKMYFDNITVYFINIWNESDPVILYIGFHEDGKSFEDSLEKVIYRTFNEKFNVSSYDTVGICRLFDSYEYESLFIDEYIES